MAESLDYKNLIESEEALKALDYSSLRADQEDYPWFASNRILEARKLRLDDSESYANALAKAALFSLNREHLKSWMERPAPAQETEAEHEEIQWISTESEAEAASAATDQEALEQSQESIQENQVEEVPEDIEIVEESVEAEADVEIASEEAGPVEEPEAISTDQLNHSVADDAVSESEVEGDGLIPEVSVEEHPELIEEPPADELDEEMESIRRMAEEIKAEQERILGSDQTVDQTEIPDPIDDRIDEPIDEPIDDSIEDPIDDPKPWAKRDIFGSIQTLPEHPAEDELDPFRIMDEVHAEESVESPIVDSEQAETNEPDSADELESVIDDSATESSELSESLESIQQALVEEDPEQIEDFTEATSEQLPEESTEEIRTEAESEQLEPFIAESIQDDSAESEEDLSDLENEGDEVSEADTDVLVEEELSFSDWISRYTQGQTEAKVVAASLEAEDSPDSEARTEDIKSDEPDLSFEEASLDEPTEVPSDSSKTDIQPEPLPKQYTTEDFQYLDKMISFQRDKLNQDQQEGAGNSDSDESSEPVLKPSAKRKEIFPATETWARILADQGKISQAIEVLEELSLLHPSKSAYFANLIEEFRSSR